MAECPYTNGEVGPGACSVGIRTSRCLGQVPTSCYRYWRARAEAAETILKLICEDGVARVEKHLAGWGRGEALTKEQQRDVHLVALGGLLLLSPTEDRPLMARLHVACGCIVCRGEAQREEAEND